jgi:hypothetical protein
MTTRKTLVLLAAAAGAVAVLRRHRSTTARVDVYFQDGSMVTLERGAPQADRTLALAADALAATRGA